MQTIPDYVLQFDIAGSAAHFKKFYSNVSALTYDFPSRTNIMGILASILKKSRDSYYDELASDKSKIGVRPLTPLRKYFTYTNYHNPKQGGNIQTRVELIFPKEPIKKLKYRIFFFHKDKSVAEELYKKLKSGDDGYGLYLGQRQLRANLHDPKWWDKDQFTYQKEFQGTIHSAIPYTNFADKENFSGKEITSFLMPMDMKQVKDGREPQSTAETLCELSGEGVNGSFNEAFLLPEENIVFFSQINS